MNARQRANGAARGRPVGPRGSPLAAFIAERLRQQGLTQDALAARLPISSSTLSRLLSGKTRWTRITPQAIADALELQGDDRARFMELCARQPHASHEPTSRLAAPEPRKATGRPTHESASPVGLLIEPLLSERGVTRSALAHALGVRESTVTRMMSGAQATSHVISAQGVSAALGLDGMTRRRFLEQALALGAFALASGHAAPPALRYSGVDLAQFDEELASVGRLLDTGIVAEGLTRARALYHAILKAPFARTHQAAAQRRIDAALTLGRAQEAGLPWGVQRTGPAVQTYNHVDREILSRFAISPFAHYYARLLERRAPLYRELEDYAESIRQFTYAIDLCMPYVDDLALLSTLYRSRAHVWAVQGREREWRRDIESALRVANRAPSDARRHIEGLILYSEAEGYKRLAGSVPPYDYRRQRAYAQAALSSFSAARAMTLDLGETHTILLDVSLAQSHLWLDADESARLAEATKARARAYFPALLHKSELAIAAANSLRGR